MSLKLLEHIGADLNGADERFWIDETGEQNVNVKFVGDSVPCLVEDGLEDRCVFEVEPFQFIETLENTEENRVVDRSNIVQFLTFKECIQLGLHLLTVIIPVRVQQLDAVISGIDELLQEDLDLLEDFLNQEDDLVGLFELFDVIRLLNCRVVDIQTTGHLVDFIAELVQHVQVRHIAPVVDVEVGEGALFGIRLAKCLAIVEVLGAAKIGDTCLVVGVGI